MNFSKIVFLILNVLYSFLCEEKELTQNKKLNVIIFFSHIDTKCISLQKDTLGFLNLHEATRVKHSSENENVFESVPEISSARRKSSAYCKELLKNSLMTLTHFCHTVLKMKTAIASVSSKEITNDIQEPEAPFHETNIGPYSDVAPKTKRSASNFDKEPMQSILVDNPIKPKAKKIITSAKHTEVFNIRVKRQDQIEHDEKDVKMKFENGAHIKKNHHTKPSWDILDVMKHVRYSFLGKIFQDTLQNQINADQEDVVDITKLGKQKQDPGLFTMVKSTLTTLLEPPETNFLMVVFGGHLHAIADKHSPIVQSIKHVIENTQFDNTLIVVTGSCAEDLAKENHKSENEVKESTLPVYAKGPNCDILSECSLLYDIPLTIRKILELHNGSGLQFSEHENA